MWSRATRQHLACCQCFQVLATAAKLPVQTVLPYVWIQQSAHSWRWHIRMPLLHIEYKYSPQICVMPAAHFLYPRNSSSKLRSLDWPSTSSVAPQTWNHLFSLMNNDRTREPSKYIKMLVEKEKAVRWSKLKQANVSTKMYLQSAARCVSVSLFHFKPLLQPTRLLEAARRCRFGLLPWINLVIARITPKLRKSACSLSDDMMTSSCLRFMWYCCFFGIRFL